MRSLIAYPLHRFATRCHRLAILVVLMLICAPLQQACSAEESVTAEQIVFFERKVRPVLSARCYDCHSGKSK